MVRALGLGTEGETALAAVPGRLQRARSVSVSLVVVVCLYFAGTVELPSPSPLRLARPDFHSAAAASVDWNSHDLTAEFTWASEQRQTLDYLGRYVGILGLPSPRALRLARRLGTECFGRILIARRRQAFYI